jgi:hypothetical protein
MRASISTGGVIGSGSYTTVAGDITDEATV